MNCLQTKYTVYVNLFFGFVLFHNPLYNFITFSPGKTRGHRSMLLLTICKRLGKEPTLLNTSRVGGSAESWLVLIFSCSQRESCSPHHTAEYRPTIPCAFCDHWRLIGVNWMLNCIPFLARLPWYTSKTNLLWHSWESNRYLGEKPLYLYHD